MFDAIRSDIRTVMERDPAARSRFEVLISYPGVHALAFHRASNRLWRRGWLTAARFVSHLSRFLTGIEIHPAAKMGRGVFIDHGTGFVAGETSAICDDVSILHEVTLGGTGKERGDRHPKVRRGVLLGAGAKVLGNIEIGACAKIAAGSVVLEPVPAGCTAAGVPARIIGCVDVPEPALEMDQRI